MKKTFSFLLALLIMLTSSFTFAATAVEYAVPRSFGLKMSASVATYKDVEYIAVDVSVADITDPYGILSIEFDLQFDADKLTPLWQTDKELNGDGATLSVPPQMIVAWPTYKKTYNIPGYGLYTADVFAAEGLCKAYSKTGPGKLNINLTVDLSFSDEAVTKDGGMRIRLYFIPKNGINDGDSYTFTIDDNVHIGWDDRAQITVAGTSGALTADPEHDKTKLRIYGKGTSCTFVVGGALKGDINGDGKVNSLDAAMILRYDADLLDLADSALALGDVNLDGKVNSLDAAMVLRYDAGLIPSL